MSTTIAEAQDVKVLYGREGWCQLPIAFSAADVAKLGNSIEAISAQQRPEVVYEAVSSVVRAVHGCHKFDEVCARLVRLPVLVDLAETLLGGEVYVYQFKVNMKQPLEGAAWPWHQDFVFWHKEDGMPRPEAVNIAIFLDDVQEENGPLKVIPGSHHLGLIDSGEQAASEPSHDWRRHVAAALAYTVPNELADSLAGTYGTQSFTGAAGTAIAFHPNIVHSSSNNLSGRRRAVLLITYNRVTNAPVNPTRPEFLVSRNSTPVLRVDDNHL